MDKDREIEEIVDTVCNYYNVSADEVRSRSKKTRILIPRHVSVYFIRKKLRLPLARISGYFNRDHATAINSIKKVEFYIECYEDFRSEMKAVDFQIRLSSIKLDNEDIFRHLAFIFMTQHSDKFVKSGITENDTRFLAKDFKISEELLNNLIMGLKEEKERDKSNKGSLKEEKINKTQNNDLGGSKKETFKGIGDGKETFGI